MTDMDHKQMQALDAQIALHLKQSTTEFWKVAIAAAVAGAIIGGTAVQVANLTRPQSPLVVIEREAGQ